jgi:hypothetical protein
MENNEKLSDEKFWGNKIREHWKTFMIAIIAGIVACLGAVLVVFWFMLTSPIGGQGTWFFNDWTLMHVVCFIILLILWELLFVGVPTGLFFGLGGYIWWRRLPDEEKQEFKARTKKETHRARNWGGGGGGGLFMFIAFCIFVAVDGFYDTQFSLLPYSYFVRAWFLTLMWIIIYFGIPAGVILLIVYFKVWRKKSE